VVEFVDGRRLGPAFRFLHEHRMEDEKGHLLGYRGLDRIQVSIYAACLSSGALPDIYLSIFS
jgi:hypothetical protein